ncbi:hypothetical protein ACVNPX_02205 [Staphylococcus aureus]
MEIKGIHYQNTVKQSVKFMMAQAKRDAYTNAVSRAETSNWSNARCKYV